MTNPLSVAQQRGQTSPDEHGGMRSVLLVLLSLGAEAASAVLSKFAASEIEAISNAAATLGELDAAALQQVAEAFRRDFETGPRFVGSAEEIKVLLAAVAPTVVAPTALEAPRVQIWDRVKALSDKQLSAYLGAQHPQTLAYILSNLERERAASILSELLTPQRNDIMMRILSLHTVPDAVRAMVEAAVQSELLEAAAPSADQHRALADLLNRLDQQQSREVIQHLESRRPTDASLVKKYLFQFEDLPTLPQKSRSLVLDRVATESVIVALYGADPTLQSSLLAALAPRARRMVESELQSAAVPMARDVSIARRLIASAVLTLVGEGLVTLPDVVSEVQAAEGDQTDV